MLGIGGNVLLGGNFGTVGREAMRAERDILLLAEFGKSGIRQLQAGYWFQLLPKQKEFCPTQN